LCLGATTPALKFFLGLCLGTIVLLNQAQPRGHLGKEVGPYEALVY